VERGEQPPLQHTQEARQVKYLNSDSHHHRRHKTTVLSGIELHLALLTTRTPTNANLSLSDIYLDKDKALPKTWTEDADAQCCP
jgi:hypothetical protein